MKKKCFILFDVWSCVLKWKLGIFFIFVKLFRFEINDLKFEKMKKKIMKIIDWNEKKIILND